MTNIRSIEEQRLRAISDAEAKVAQLVQQMDAIESPEQPDRDDQVRRRCGGFPRR